MASGTEGVQKATEEAPKKKEKASPKEKAKKALGTVKFEIFTGVNNLLYWRFIGTKGTPIVISAGAALKEQCYEGIRNIKQNAANQHRYEKASLDSGKFAFRLRAANHRVVAESVSFSTAEERDQAMGEMKRAYQAAIISP